MAVVPSVVLEERAVLEKSKTKIFDLVCQRATREQWAEWLRAPLEHAAAAGDVDLVNDLLEAGANGQAGWKGCRNRSLLCAAVQGGKREVVSALLKAGAKQDLHVLSGDAQWSLLHYAASGGHEAIAKLLLLSGAAPNCKDNNGDSPIHIAAWLGHEEIVSLLLLGGADVNMLDNSRRTPLHLAAKHGRLSTVETLLTSGADMNLRNGISCSALDCAALEGHVDVIKELLQHGDDVMSCAPSGGTALHMAARKNQAAAVEALVRAGADVDARSKGIVNNAPLHWAVKHGSCDALLVLLRHKADVNAQDNSLRTPLMMACRWLQQEAARILLRWGADETTADSEGCSADQLIGNGISPSEQEARAGEMESMRGLLKRAPADRAWRRRGLLVLCRAIPSKDQPGISSVPQSDGSKEPKDNRIDIDCSVDKVHGELPEKSVNDQDRDGYDWTTGDTEGCEGERCGSLWNIEARVVGLEQEGLFRDIVSFL